MLPRFLAPDLASGGAEIDLPPEEAHHLARVLRLEVGDEVLLFDGRGHESRARVSTISRRAVRAVLLAPAETVRDAPVALTIVQGVLKGAAMDDVVRDCTMVGVRAIVPVLSGRIAVKRSSAAGAVARWRRIALASAKQCGRARLPELGHPVTLDGWIGSHKSGDPAFLLLEPGAFSSGTLTIRALAARPAPASASLLVGPEGGWTGEEIARALAAGCQPLSLGPLTLRAAAVPLVAAGALLGIWSSSG